VEKAVETAPHQNGTEPPEKEIWAGRFSLKGMAVSFACSALATVAMIVAVIVGAWSSTTWLWVTALIFLPMLWIVQAIRFVKRWLQASYRLTDRRLLRQRGVFQRHKDQLDLARVETERILQNVVHRFLDVGSIEILSSDRRLGRLIMEGIDDADGVAETIRALARFRQSPPVEAAELLHERDR